MEYVIIIIMILLTNYGAGKIGVVFNNSVAEEEKAAHKAAMAVGGTITKTLGLHFHKDSIARFISLLEGWSVELDKETQEFIDKEYTTVVSAIDDFYTRLEEMSNHLATTLDITPMPHQIEGAKWLVQKKKAILADDMGTGKSGTVMLALPKNCAVLVEAPAMAVGVWKKHFEEWRPDFKVFVCLSEKKFRMPEVGEAIIVSRGAIPPTVKEIQQIQEGKRKSRSGRLEAITINAYALEMKTPFYLVADEAHQFKSAGSLQTQKHRVLVKETLKRNGYVWMVTGTPMLNRPPDLWGVLQSTGCASEVFGGWIEFARLFGGRPGPFGGYYWPEVYGDLDKLSKNASDKLKQVMIRRPFEKVRPDLPLKRRYLHTISIEEVKDTKTWKLMEDALVALESAGLTIDQMLSMLEKGQSKKLPINPFTLRKALSAAKVPVLLQLVQQAEEDNEPIIVACAHTAPLDAIRSRKGWAIIDGSTAPLERKNIEEKFQKGEYKGLGLSIEAGGMALSLHRARRMIFVDLEWTPGQNTQMEDRIRRVQQTRGCIYTILALDHNYEKKMLTALVNKAKLIDKTINVLADHETIFRVDQLDSLIDQNTSSFSFLKSLSWDKSSVLVNKILAMEEKDVTPSQLLFVQNLAKTKGLL